MHILRVLGQVGHFTRVLKESPTLCPQFSTEKTPILCLWWRASILLSTCHQWGWQRETATQTATYQCDSSKYVGAGQRHVGSPCGPHCPTQATAGEMLPLMIMGVHVWLVPAVFISCGCCNKPAQTRWLKTPGICFLIVWKLEVWNPGVSRAWSLWRLLGRPLFLLQLLGTPSILGLWLPSPTLCLHLHTKFSSLCLQLPFVL